MARDPTATAWGNRVIGALSVFILLYVVALHASMAGMELFGWASATAALTGFLLWRQAELKKFATRYASILLLLAGLFVWVIVSLVSSPLEKSLEMQVGYMRWALLVPLLALSLRIAFESREFERRLVQVWMLCFAITALYAVLQFFTGWDFVRPGRDLVKPQGGGIFKAVGFFSFSLTYAYVIGQSFLALLPSAMGFKSRALTMGFVVLGSMAVLASMSRGAWVAACLAILFYVFFVRRKWVIPVALVMFAVIRTTMMMNEGLAKKFDSIVTQSDHSSAVRRHIWAGYWEMFKDHPIVGVGLLEGDRLLPEYYSRLAIEEKFVSHAHNNYLQFLAGSGIPALMLYLGICVYFLKLAWDLRTQTPLGWGLLLPQIYLHLGGLTEANFLDGEVGHMLVFIWAITWAIHARGLENERA